MMPAPTPPRLLSIEELNQLPRQAFAPALAPLVEAAGPLAEALYGGRPFRSYDDLLERAESVVTSLPSDQQAEVIDAHPRIGEPLQALRERSPLSYREQGYDRVTEADRAAEAAVDRELAELNRVYEKRFGFRFVVFVNRRPRSEIVAVLQARLQRTPDEERATALSEMLAIARDRLRTLTADGGR